MFAKIKEFFRSEDDRKLDEAQKNFDALMVEVDKDTADLAKLEERVRDEIDGIEGGVKNIRERVDGVVGDKAI